MGIEEMQLVVPWLGESISEAVIARWLKEPGEPVRADEPVADLETDKVNVQLPAPAAGVMSAQLYPTGATVRVGEVIGRIAPGDASASSRPTPAPPAAPSPKPVAAPSDGAVGAITGRPAAASAATGGVSGAGATATSGLTPSRRKAMREQGGEPAASVVPLARPETTPRPAPSAPNGREEVVPMTPLRKRIAERLVQAQHSAAILTTFNEVDMTNLMALRTRFQEEFQKKHGCKLGLMSFFTKACLAALKDFPGLNAEVRADAIVYKKHFDIGIAVGSGRGLVVPVLRDADRMSFAELERGIGGLATKAQENRLTLDDLAGGTFTITNGGVYGSLMSTPLLNPPQTGILGMHKIMPRPVAIEGRSEVRPMMYIALSYDHRVVDGRESVQFLIGVKQRIEEPDRLMFEI